MALVEQWGLTTGIDEEALEGVDFVGAAQVWILANFHLFASNNHRRCLTLGSNDILELHEPIFRIQRPIVQPTDVSS